MGSPYIPKYAGRAALAEIGKVNWEELQHCYSGAGYDFSEYAVPSDDFPAILKAFFDEDAEMRVEAQEGIRSSAWHQGTIYEITGHVVPFLAAFAADPVTPSRGRIVSCLMLIASSAYGGDDREAGSVIAALSASRTWLEKASEAGPLIITDAIESLLGILGAEPPDPDDFGAAAYETAAELDEAEEEIDAEAEVEPLLERSQPRHRDR